MSVEEKRWLQIDCRRQNRHSQEHRGPTLWQRKLESEWKVATLGYPQVPWVFHITFDFIGKIILMQMTWKNSHTVSEASFTDPPTHDNSFQSHMLRTAT